LAEYGQRVIAYLIDVAIIVVAVIAVIIVSVIIGAVVKALGLVIGILGYIAVILYGLWNLTYLQGTTGQSIGKRLQGIKLIKEETLQPVGFGLALGRYFLAQAISGVTCGVYGILDLLWPLWDTKKQRLTDKILKMAVVQGEKGNVDAKSFIPF
jgi:uncharacterized RDD family membrane protein YckC